MQRITLRRLRELSDLLKDADQLLHLREERTILDDTETAHGRILHETTEALARIELEFYDSEAEEPRSSFRGDLDEIFPAIADAEGLVDRFISLNYSDPWYMSKCEYIIVAAIRSDEYLTAMLHEAGLGFNDRLKQLRENRRDKDFCTGKREELNQLSEDAEEVMRIMRRREVPISGFLARDFGDYNRKRKRIDGDGYRTSGLRNYVQYLYDKFYRFAESEKPLLELVGLVWKTRTLIPGGTYSRCKRAEFYEGMIDVKRLKKDVRQVLRHYRKTLRLKREVNDAVAKAETYSLRLSTIGENNFTAGQLNALRETREWLGAIDTGQYKGNVYLTNAIRAYEEATSPIRQRTYALLAIASGELANKRRSIEARCKSTPGNLEELTAFCLEVANANKELKSLSTLYHAIGDSTSAIAVDTTAKRNAAKKDEYSDMLEIYREVESANREVHEIAARLKDVNLTMIDDLSAVFGMVAGVRTMTCPANGDLESDYMARYHKLRRDADGLRDMAVASVDNLLADARDDETKDIDYILTLYTKLSPFIDVAGKIGEIRNIIERRRENKQVALQEAELGGLRKRVNELEANIAESSAAAERLKAQYEQQSTATAMNAHNALASYATQIGDLRYELARIREEKAGIEARLGGDNEVQEGLRRSIADLTETIRQLETRGPTVVVTQVHPEELQPSAPSPKGGRQEKEYDFGWFYGQGDGNTVEQQPAQAARAGWKKKEPDVAWFYATGETGKDRDMETPATPAHVTDEADRKPFFSLGLYASVNVPENPGNYRLRTILTGNDGETRWDKRFERFCHEVERGVTIETPKDVEYFSIVAHGISRAIESPEPHFDVSGAKKALKCVEDLLGRVSVN